MLENVLAVTDKPGVVLEQVIHCRRRSVPSCYNGMSATQVYEDGDPAEDGTYDPDTGTVVCDACYVGF